MKVINNSERSLFESNLKEARCVVSKSVRHATMTFVSKNKRVNNPRGSSLYSNKQEPRNKTIVT